MKEVVKGGTNAEVRAAINAEFSRLDEKLQDLAGRDDAGTFRAEAVASLAAQPDALGKIEWSADSQNGHLDPEQTYYFVGVFSLKGSRYWQTEEFEMTGNTAAQLTFEIDKSQMVSVLLFRSNKRGVYDQPGSGYTVNARDCQMVRDDGRMNPTPFAPPPSNTYPWLINGEGIMHKGHIQIGGLVLTAIPGQDTDENTLVPAKWVKDFVAAEIAKIKP